MSKYPALLSNAGIQFVHPLEEFSYADWKNDDAGSLHLREHRNLESLEELKTLLISSSTS